MKKFFIVVLILAVLISSVACSRDTRIELSGLELK